MRTDGDWGDFVFFLGLLASAGVRQRRLAASKDLFKAEEAYLREHAWSPQERFTKAGERYWYAPEGYQDGIGRDCGGHSYTQSRAVASQKAAPNAP